MPAYSLSSSHHCSTQPGSTLVLTSSRTPARVPFVESSSTGLPRGGGSRSTTHHVPGARTPRGVCTAADTCAGRHGSGSTGRWSNDGRSRRGMSGCSGRTGSRGSGDAYTGTKAAGRIRTRLISVVCKWTTASCGRTAPSSLLVGGPLIAGLRGLRCWLRSALTTATRATGDVGSGRGRRGRSAACDWLARLLTGGSVVGW